MKEHTIFLQRLRYGDSDVAPHSSSLQMHMSRDENKAETNGPRSYHICFNFCVEAENNIETSEMNMKTDIIGNKHRANMAQTQ